jgi:transcriptional regulator with XRE-family HTH domain
MIQTSPATLWANQMPLDPRWPSPIASFGNAMHQRRPDPVLHIIYRFVDRTDDGGALLRWDRCWQFERISDRMSVILSGSPFIPLAFTKPTGHELAMVPPAKLDINAPHLDAIQWMKEATGLSQERIGRLIGVTRQTINRWENGEPITDAHRRRLLAVRDVLERAASRHPTPAQLAAWLDTPRGAEGVTPADLLARGEIARARLLAMSTPSPRLARAPAWVNRPVPPAFRAGAEHRHEPLLPEQDDELAALIKDEERDTDTE